MRVVRADLSEGAMMVNGPVVVKGKRLTPIWWPAPPLYTIWTTDKTGKLVANWKEAA